MVYRWSNVELSTNITVKQMSKKDLPLYMGRYPYLDKMIAAALKEPDNKIWVEDSEKITIMSKEVSAILDLVKDDRVEIEIELTSSGNRYQGDGEDEREITSVTLVPYNDEESVYVNDLEKDNSLAIYVFGTQFEEHINEIELPDTCFESPDLDYYLDRMDY